MLKLDFTLINKFFFSDAKVNRLHDESYREWFQKKYLLELFKVSINGFWALSESCVQ